MADYIDRQAAYDVLTAYYHHATDVQHNALREALNKVPSADVQPVRHGHWINHPDDLFPEDSSIECSICHEWERILANDNFCPNCGARMDGEHDG